MSALEIDQNSSDNYQINDPFVCLTPCMHKVSKIWAKRYLEVEPGESITSDKLCHLCNKKVTAYYSNIFTVENFKESIIHTDYITFSGGPHCKGHITPVKTLNLFCLNPKGVISRVLLHDKFDKCSHPIQSYVLINFKLNNIPFSTFQNCFNAVCSDITLQSELKSFGNIASVLTYTKKEELFELFAPCLNLSVDKKSEYLNFIRQSQNKPSKTEAECVLL